MPLDNDDLVYSDVQFRHRHLIRLGCLKLSHLRAP